MSIAKICYNSDTNKCECSCREQPFARIQRHTAENFWNRSTGAVSEERSCREISYKCVIFKIHPVEMVWLYTDKLRYCHSLYKNTCEMYAPPSQRRRAHSKARSLVRRLAEPVRSSVCVCVRLCASAADDDSDSDDNSTAATRALDLSMYAVVSSLTCGSRSRSLRHCRWSRRAHVLLARSCCCCCCGCTCHACVGR